MNHPRHKVTIEDVQDIRQRYANHERCKDVEQLYKDKIGHSGFSKIWKGETWTSVMMEVYTFENKEFHRHNTGQVGSQNGRALLTEQQVSTIRKRILQGENWMQIYPDYQYTKIKPESFRQLCAGARWKHIII